MSIHGDLIATVASPQDNSLIPETDTAPHLCAETVNVSLRPFSVLRPWLPCQAEYAPDKHEKGAYHETEHCRERDYSSNQHED